VPTTAFGWGAYRAAQDPRAPPAQRTPIAADLAGAAARGVPLTARGLTYALDEAATARGPRWPYLFAVWQAHPHGPAERGTRIAELPNAERRTRNAEYGWRADPPYRRTPRSAIRNPQSLDPRKYALGGKYGHLFARPAAAVT
jgi:hypothetical protein